MKKRLYQQIQDTAAEIKKAAEKDGFLAKCAARKVAAISENSSLEALIKTASDLVLIAEKLA